jgi:hypothetical protein
MRELKFTYKDLLGKFQVSPPKKQAEMINAMIEEKLKPAKPERSKVPKGPICFECAEKKGGVSPTYPVAGSSQRCAHCKKKKGCPSVSDFAWGKVPAIWD